MFEIILGKEGDQLTYECKVTLPFRDLCAGEQTGKGVFPLHPKSAPDSVLWSLQAPPVTQRIVMWLF